MFEEEQVTEDEARQFAQSINAVFRMTSALKSEGIEDLFDCIGRKFIDPSYDEENPNNIQKKKREKNNDYRQREVKLDSNQVKNNNKGGCCRKNK